jgi:hypothetical protein
MTIVKKRTNELCRRLHYDATWLAGAPVELGTIDMMVDKPFTPVSNLMNVSIDFETEEDTTRSDLEHTSQGAVTLYPKLSGQVPVAGSVLGQADAGFTMEFSRKDAILFVRLKFQKRSALKFVSRTIPTKSEGKYPMTLR